MATVPGVFLFGDYEMNGGQPGLTADYAPDPLAASLGQGLPLTPLSAILDRELLQITPCAANGTPNAGTISCWPWYDGGADDPANMLVVTGAGPTGNLATSATFTLGGGSPGWHPTNNEWAGRLVSFCQLDSGSGGPMFPGAGGVTFRRRAVITANTADTVTYASGTAPQSGCIAFVGRGRFRDYHPAAGHLDSSEIGSSNSIRGGSTWYSGGQGVGPDATLVRRLLEDVYDTAPYFHLWKFATTGAMTTSWGDSPRNASRTTLTSELARVVAAATAVGNTIDWKHIIIDMQIVDAIYGATSLPNAANLVTYYQQSLTEFVAWLRSASVFNAPTATVHLMNNSTELYTVANLGAGVGAGSVAISLMRGYTRDFARLDGNARVLEKQGAKVGTGIAVPAEDPNSNANDYALCEYFRFGEQMSESIRIANLGIATEPTQGYPVYLMIGDSIAAGPATQAWVLASNSERISGPTPGNTLRPSNQKVWVRGSLALAIYEPGVNSNTSGTLSASSGPDLSIMANLGELHPGGFALVKRASNGSTLGPNTTPYDPGTGGYGSWLTGEAEHYPLMLEDLGACFQYINETTGKQVDFRGAFVFLGTNDGAISGGGTTFADELEAFCELLWDDIATRTSGPRPPIVWRRPQLGVAGGITAELTLIRRALDLFAIRQDQFRVVDVDDLERDRGDNIHETPDSAVEDGDRMFAALQRIALA